MNALNIPDIVSRIPDTPQDVDLLWDKEFDVEDIITREEEGIARSIKWRQEFYAQNPHAAPGRGDPDLIAEVLRYKQKHHDSEIEDLRHLYSMPPTSRLYGLLTGDGTPYTGYIAIYKEHHTTGDQSDYNLINHMVRMRHDLRLANAFYNKAKDDDAGWLSELRAFARLRWLQDCATSQLYDDNVPAGHVVSAPLPEWCDLDAGPWEDMHLYPRESGAKPRWEKDWAG